MAQHALLSPSSAARWIACPGSVHMCELYPDSGPSAAAAEGTLAHKMAEIYFRSRDSAIGFEEDFDKLNQKLGQEISDFYHDHPDIPGSVEAMSDYILDDYCEYVDQELEKAIEKDDTAFRAVEQKVHFDDYIPNGFGTSDVVIIGGGTIEVIDLKYGKGVPVSAVGNPQIRLYALGAIDLFDMLYEFDTVKMVICQPRLDSITEETMTVEDLKAWGNEVIVPAVRKAMQKDKEYHPGEWCQSKFCPGRTVCTARARYFLELEEQKKRDPAVLTNTELGDILQRADGLDKWIKDLKTRALSEISEGREVTGWKVVEGRSNWKYKDEQKVADALRKAGYQDAVIYDRVLIGLTKAESLLGKKKFQEVLGKLVEKPAGAPTLAPASDKRPAIDTLVNEFKED